MNEINKFNFPGPYLITISGKGIPDPSLATQIGDQYIDSDTGNLYICMGPGKWGFEGTIER